MPSDIFIQNPNKPIDRPARVKFCDSFFCRLRGLMFRSVLARDEGLVLVIGRDSRPDSSIHMLFVSFDLAVFWINSEMVVVDKVMARSWRPAYFPAKAARYILEIHPSRYGDYEIGDKVEFKNA
ncbi:MAG TPA: DUF192 domain-containing protein [Anaerolineales bacterium]|nr:DUF192 domain-containing protein [Anaerolineales bacterium]